MTRLYRVITRTTGSKQPAGQGTTWKSVAVYCGPDRFAARLAYHQNTSNDYGGSHGNSARETVCEIIDDAGTDDFDDDAISAED